MDLVAARRAKDGVMTGWSRKLKVSSDVFLSQKLKQVQAESNTGKTKGSLSGRQLAGKALTMQ